MKVVMTCFALFATPASAEAIREWGHGSMSQSWVEVHEPTEPNAVATVTFYNAQVHTRDETFTLSFNGLDIGFDLDWQHMGGQSERLTVYPPPGHIAVPPDILVAEDTTETVQIYLWEGM